MCGVSAFLDDFVRTPHLMACYTAMAMQFSLDTVRAVARLLNEASLAEISIENVQPGEDGDSRLVMRRPATTPGARRSRAGGSNSKTPSTTPLAGPAVEAAKATAPPRQITAGAVGLFRHAATAVRVGDEVRAGQDVGILEVLNVRNEIKVDAPGHVTQVLVDDGQGVEFGQPLFTLENEPPEPVDSGAAEEA